jgi:hypothetical protein
LYPESDEKSDFYDLKAARAVHCHPADFDIDLTDAVYTEVVFQRHKDSPLKFRCDRRKILFIHIEIQMHFQIIELIFVQKQDFSYADDFEIALKSLNHIGYGPGRYEKGAVLALY